MEQREDDANGGQESPEENPLVNDADGDRPAPHSGGGGADVYLAPVKPLAEWPFVDASFDFLAGEQPRPDTFGVYLMPRPEGFMRLHSEPRAETLQFYRALHEQITSPGVTFYAETNLVLRLGGTMARVALTAQQSAEVVRMVTAIVHYLEVAAPGARFVVPRGVEMPVTITRGEHDKPPPPLFEIEVRFGIRRDPDCASPPSDDGGQFVSSRAEYFSSAVEPAFGHPPGDGSTALEKFAADFVQAFGGLKLAVLPDRDGEGASGFGRQPLWAVRKALLDISIGPGAQNECPLFMSPKPLDNALRAGVVPLPSLPSWAGSRLPPEMFISGADLDSYNRALFRAVDDILAPESSQAFMLPSKARESIEGGRRALAQKYSRHEVCWMFGPGSPFTGTPDQLAAGREAFGRQMRSALTAAYSFDTVVQFPVVWKETVPDDADDMISLFGRVRPIAESPARDSSGLSTAWVNVRAAAPGTLTFLYGTLNIEDVSEVTLHLEFDVTHVEYYLLPASRVPEGLERPSVRLRLVDPYPDVLPHVGPEGKPTTIPLVFREHPSPPVIIESAGAAGTSSRRRDEVPPTPLANQGDWHFTYSYQSRFTAHDELLTAVAYNTDLRDSSGGGGRQLTADGADPSYSLFESLARFNAVYSLLLPILSEPTSPYRAETVGLFAGCVNEVVANADWNPPPKQATVGATGLPQVISNYTITDPPAEGPRIITLAWKPGQRNVSPALSVLAISPDGSPYSDPPQRQEAVANAVTTTYTPAPLQGGYLVTHQIEVGSLNVLSVENALASVRLRRNLIVLPDPDGKPWTINDEFVYETPTIRASGPVSMYVINDAPIDLASLPNQGQGAACPPSAASLCQRIFTMLHSLLAEPPRTAVPSMAATESSAGDDTGAKRRLRVACDFRHRVSSSDGGQSGEVSIYAVIPVMLMHSLEVSVADTPLTDELSRYATQFAQGIRHWSEQNFITFGPTATQDDARLVFEITLYALLSAPNTPVLRLSNLQLKLTDVDPL
jgi:hypothetical protein